MESQASGSQAEPGGSPAGPVPETAPGPETVPGPETATEIVPEQGGRVARSGATLHWRTTLLLASAFATVLLASATMLIPVPYVVLRPGPAINTLGKDDGHDLIAVKGHATYPAKGSLDLTTVTLQGGPDARLSVYQVVAGWFDRTVMVVPEVVLYPPGQTAESSRQENQDEMVSSQESATVAALRELGVTVPTTLTVHSVDAGTPPSPLRSGDVILAVNGRRIDQLSTLESIMSTVKPGATVQITVRRAGATPTLTAPTRAWEGGRTILGIRVDPSFRAPFEVTIRIGNVGGPSAGTMFALGIIDVLTPGDLTGGQHIAGTGTITENGEVGSIGGVQQKLIGARAAGARWFLAPADNCRDVAGHIPGGLRVVSVKDLHDARQAVEAIGSGRTAGLTFCPTTRSGPVVPAQP